MLLGVPVRGDQMNILFVNFHLIFSLCVCKLLLDIYIGQMCSDGDANLLQLPNEDPNCSSNSRSGLEFHAARARGLTRHVINPCITYSLGYPVHENQKRILFMYPDHMFSVVVNMPRREFKAALGKGLNTTRREPMYHIVWGARLREP